MISGSDDINAGFGQRLDILRTNASACRGIFTIGDDKIRMGSFLYLTESYEECPASGLTDYITYDQYTELFSHAVPFYRA